MMICSPLSAGTAWRAVARCIAVSIAMGVRREIHQPRSHLGQVIGFGDGTSGRVYRETTVERSPGEPCVLVVCFRLRGVRGRGHAVFRAESLLNTPLFVGFPGFVSKLWLAHDEQGTYRGLYEWDGADRAEHYARCLWHVLALICEGDSIDYRVLPGLSRDQFLGDPSVRRARSPGEESAWWRVVAAA